MYFDPSQNAYVDEETGAVVCYADDDEDPGLGSPSTHSSHSHRTHRSRGKKDKKTRHRSRQGETYAMTRQDDFPSLSHDSRFNGRNDNNDNEFVIEDRDKFERMFELAALNHQENERQREREDNLSQMESALYDMYAHSHIEDADNPHATRTAQSVNDLSATATATATSSAAEHETDADRDWNFARTLQMLEFEIGNEEMRDGFEDFNQKEYRASKSCRRQMATMSFFICIVQIALLIAMVQTDGWASSAANSAVGPPVTAMVRYGAKDAALIKYKDEWWRLISSIMLHAGIYHLIPNVAIQLRVGGYLNIVYGTPRWMFIYFMSGIFGEMMSCVFIPDSVGVGSSGALMGLLSSWVVWIIFRWKKIPPACKSQRNCQLGVVVVSIVVTLATSFMPQVDWAAHAGGALMGVIWGFLLLSNQLENTQSQRQARAVAFVIFCVIFGYSLYYMIVVMDPTRLYLSYWAMNDDWNHHP